MGQRPIHGAGEAGNQREAGERASIALARELSERREGRVIQRHRHCDAGDAPAAEEHGIAGCDGQDGERCCTDERAAAQDEAAVPRIDEPAGPGTQQSGDRECKREAGEHFHAAEVQLCADRLCQHRDGIEKRTPGDDLSDAEGWEEYGELWLGWHYYLNPTQRRRGRRARRGNVKTGLDIFSTNQKAGSESWLRSAFSALSASSVPLRWVSRFTRAPTTEPDSSAS